MPVMIAGSSHAGANHVMNRGGKHNSPMPSRPLVACASVILAFAFTSCRTPQPEPRITPYYPRCPDAIATQGRAQVHELVSFFTETNRDIDLERLNWIARIYIDEAAAEGINHDIAFCQMLHETNYLRFGGDVRPWQNNFCGLGATGGGEPGLSFPSVRIGIRAQIQHLKAYANSLPLRNACVDPRFEKVVRGSAPCVSDLTDKWATDPLYGIHLNRKLRQLEAHLRAAGPQ